MLCMWNLHFGLIVKVTASQRDAEGREYYGPGSIPAPPSLSFREKKSAWVA